MNAQSFLKELIMSADTTQGTGLGAAVTTRGPDGGKNSLYQTLSGPHVVKSGETSLGNNQWKVDVLFEKALDDSSKYSVMVTPQISLDLDYLDHDGTRYYDYSTGGNFRIRTNKLDDRWKFNSSYGTGGSWYVTAATVNGPTTNFIGFSVHLGTSNDGNNPPCKLMWTVVKIG